MKVLSNTIRKAAPKKVVKEAVPKKVVVKRVMKEKNPHRNLDVVSDSCKGITFTIYYSILQKM